MLGVGSALEEFLLLVAASGGGADFDVADGEVEEFAGGLVIGELPAGLGHLAQLVVDGLDRIGWLDHAADLGGHVQEGHELVPGSSPGINDRGTGLADVAAGEGVQGDLGRLDGRGGIDRSQVRGNGLAFPPEAYRIELRFRWTTQVWTVALGQVAPIASGRPARPSQHTMRTSLIPRLRSSVMTLHPEPGTLVGFDPDAQEPLDAVDVDTHGQVAGLDPHRPAITDPQPDRVDTDDRIDLVQGPIPPFLDLLVDRVGDVRDRLVRHTRPIDRLEVLGDVPGGHGLGIQSDDHVVEVTEPAGPLRHRDRVERAITVPRHLQIHRPRRGLHRLARQPVAGIPRPPALGRVLVITQMIGHLDPQGSLHHLLDHVRQQTPRTGQLQAIRLRLLDDPGDLSLHRPLHGIGLRRIHRHSVSFPGTTTAAPRIRPDHLHSEFDTPVHADVGALLHPKPSSRVTLIMLDKPFSARTLERVYETHRPEILLHDSDHSFANVSMELTIARPRQVPLVLVDDADYGLALCKYHAAAGSKVVLRGSSGVLGGNCQAKDIPQLLIYRASSQFFAATLFSRRPSRKLHLPQCP